VRSRICTMDRERYLCWTVLIGPLESRAYVSYAGAFSGQYRFVGTGVSLCNETLISTVLFSGISVSFPLASATANLTSSLSSSSLATTTYRRLHCLPLSGEFGGVVRREVFPIPILRGSLWVMELNPRNIYPRPRGWRKPAWRYLSPSRYKNSRWVLRAIKAEVSRSLIVLPEISKPTKIILSLQYNNRALIKYTLTFRY